ncbi:hypothetical protein PTD2_04651 [Pseudoalteromonas tunicata D2]|uniref:Uncharacterized protein n=1 Tax=Pseudoalteromonas tunicata D2 TaxID=87626 RepID=A4CFM0_9GAMM|nr:hypothetical protein PTD2_04651 [Pseudoalteromonas tunicata D2]
MALHGGYVHIKCIFEDQFAYFLKFEAPRGSKGRPAIASPWLLSPVRQQQCQFKKRFLKLNTVIDVKTAFK